METTQENRILNIIGKISEPINDTFKKGKLFQMTSFAAAFFVFKIKKGSFILLATDKKNPFAFDVDLLFTYLQQEQIHCPVKFLNVVTVEELINQTAVFIGENSEFFFKKLQEKN